MTDKQPEALRLADSLTIEDFGPLTNQAAAELRRLHEANQEYEQMAAIWRSSPEAAKQIESYHEVTELLNTAKMQRDKLREANQELVKALEAIAKGVIIPPYMTEQARQMMRWQDFAKAAIAKHGGAA